MSCFIPGQWKAAAGGLDEVRVFDDDRLVAVCPALCEGNESHIENARLIAAAPDMLSVLESLLHEVSNIHSARYFAIVEVLRKAKGME